MATLPTAAVIGAGSSGIAAAKALHERGIPFTCFEASDRVGGNWVFANKNGMSAAYRQLYINTSRDRMEYSDYPMPKSYPDFPHHTQIAAYFDAYVDHFGFRDRIRFETKVQRAARVDGGGWELTLDDGSVERFDALLVANGHHWDPRWPEPMFPGHDSFTRRADARPCLRRQRHLRRQGRGRPRNGQLGDGHRRRGLLCGAHHLPRRPPRRVDHPQVHVRAPGRPAPAGPADPVQGPPAHDPHADQAPRRQPRALRAARARPQVRRGPPDGLGADPRPHRTRNDRAQAQHPPPGRRRDRVRRRLARARRRGRLLHRLQDQLPVLRRGPHLGSRQPHRALPARLSPRGRRRLLRRAAAAAGGDDAAGRGAGPVDRRPPHGRVRAAAAPRPAAGHRGRGGGDAQALRRLQAPHDPGRLRRLPARAGQGAPGRRAARAASGLSAARERRGRRGRRWPA